jgi:hypothetical protein
MNVNLEKLKTLGKLSLKRYRKFQMRRNAQSFEKKSADELNCERLKVLN